MVKNHYFQDIFESLNETKVLNLPKLKENSMTINFTSSHEHTIVYKGQEALLPFAASEIFYAPISSWRRLTALDKNCKAVYEISFNIQGSNFNFRPGDTIGVIPRNCQSEVDTLIDHLNLQELADFNYILSIDGRQKGAKIPGHLPIECTLRHVLTHCVDLRGILKKLFLLALSRHTKDEKEKRILEYLCSKEGSIAYTTHVLNKHMCLLDLFTTLKSCKPPIGVILENLPRLLPRPYSIVNYHNANLIKICFSVMDVGNRKGLTTGWLEDIILRNDNIDDKMKNLKLDNGECKIGIYLRKNINEFNLPINLETPLIFVGPGTGVSPYIGFLEERKYLYKNNEEANLGYAWLFVGCRNPKLDFIYKDELNNYLSSNVLSKLTTSFSRYGDTENCYVQDAITQNGEEIAKLILQGANVYVCGDIKKMATSVREAIVQCVEKYGNKTTDEAEQFISDMLKDKKYLIDIWN